MAFEGLKTVLDAFRSLKGSPPGVYDLAQRIKTLLEQDEKEPAERLLLEALDRYPGHSSLEDINHFLGQKRLQDRLAGLRSAVEDARKAYVVTARAFAETDNTQKAIEFITGAFRRFPEAPELHLLLGEIHLRRYLDDRTPQDGLRAAESLERACRLDPTDITPHRWLGGLYARAGHFRRAVAHLSVLDGDCIDEEEQAYVQELSTYCSRRVEEVGETNLKHGLNEVVEQGRFHVDCGKWARPCTPAFGRRDMTSVMVPFLVLQLTARKCVELPGVAAVIVQNQVRTETFLGDDCRIDASAIENVVREVSGRSAEACRRMELGHVKRCDLKTSIGRLSLHMFADSWTGLLFTPAVSTSQVRTVTQQFLDLLSERLGDMNENHS